VESPLETYDDSRHPDPISEPCGSPGIEGVIGVFIYSDTRQKAVVAGGDAMSLRWNVDDEPKTASAAAPC
jgi:hypothetical protein